MRAGLIKLHRCTDLRCPCEDPVMRFLACCGWRCMICDGHLPGRGLFLEAHDHRHGRDDIAMELYDRNNQPSVTIYRDGLVTLARGLTFDDAARRFWSAVQSMSWEYMMGDERRTGRRSRKPRPS